MSMFIGKEGFDVYRHYEVDDDGITSYTTVIEFEYGDGFYIQEVVKSTTTFGYFLSDRMAEKLMLEKLCEISDSKLEESLG